jgi:hypothetical protein
MSAEWWLASIACSAPVSPRRMRSWIVAAGRPVVSIPIMGVSIGG